MYIARRIANEGHDAYLEYLTLDSMGMPESTLDVNEALCIRNREHMVLMAQAVDEGDPHDAGEWEVVKANVEPAEPPRNTIYTEAYNADGERILYSSRSSLEPGADHQLSQLALETKYAVRRGNYGRGLIVMLLEKVCGDALEWRFVIAAIKERCRQIEVEGRMPGRDAADYKANELPRAAACYALGDPLTDGVSQVWPWGELWWKPRDNRRNYERAVALLLAEGERMDRVESLDRMRP